MRERKRETVTVVLPTREVADTIGPILERLSKLGDVIDQILVIDAASNDDTVAIAGAGAEYTRSRSAARVRGGARQGRCTWRSLAVATAT